MAQEAPKKHIVIVGGGIIGCTTAYFLTRHPAYDLQTHHITILEATSIASGASGKAGGLLALWAYPSCIVPLSYTLHAELAKEHDGAKRWGYRTLNCAAVEARGKIRPLQNSKAHDEGNGTEKEQEEGEEEEWNKLPKTNGKSKSSVLNGVKVPSDLDWIDHDTIRAYSVMGTPSTTAQVHPYQFTTSMAELAVEAGAEIILGSVTSINSTNINSSNSDESVEGTEVKSVTYLDKATKKEHTIPASKVVISTGPWTSKIFPEAPIEAMRAHSVVIKADVAPYAIFSEITLPNDFETGGDGKGRSKRRRGYGNIVSPEMYARPDGTVYACGEGDTSIPLPETSDLVTVDSTKCEEIIDYVSTISSPLHSGTVMTKQACYLPSVSGGGGPLIGKTNVKGVFLATGHTCWGIQNSCATGKLVSEFVFEGGAKSANVGSLDPRRVLLK